MTNEEKKALFIISGGLLLFFLFKPRLGKMNADTKLNFTTEEDDPKYRKKMKKPVLSINTLKSNPKANKGFVALKAYVEAYNNGESQSVLDDLNREFAKDLQMKVYRRKSDNKIVVCDLDGKEILVNN